MNLIEKLYKTYDAHSDCICDPNDKTPLYPVDHTSFNMNIKIVLNTKGEFLRAKLIDKTDAPTIIPCVKQSRGNDITPHPLCDKLEYVAEDFLSKGGVTKNGEERYKQYLDLITAWHEFDPKNVKLSAITTYVTKGAVVNDLINAKILPVSDGLINRTGVEGIFKLLPAKGDIKNATVLWEVDDITNPNSSVIDKTLQKSWIDYMSSIATNHGLCYVTGRELPLLTIHPNKLRHTGDRAKFISSNDTEGYTFRGEFFERAHHVVGLSSEVSQKAHSALRWLIKRQGSTNGGLTHVAWGLNNVETMPITGNSFELLFDDEPLPAYTAELFAKRLNNAINGYGYNSKFTENITILSFDSTGPARMGIKYYKELSGSDFIDRIANWHITHAWDQRFGKGKNFYGSPSPFDIAMCAYGLNVSDTLIDKTKEELFPCIVDKVPVPYHLIRSCVNKLITTPKNGTDTKFMWEKTLRVTCGLLTSTEKKEDVMKLDTTNTDRDYLFGRLLAVAERVEEEHNYHKSSNRKETHASTLFARFQQYPAQTWMTIHNAVTKVIPHFGRKLYSESISEIMELFNDDDFLSNKKLAPNYLIGYYTQRKHLWDDINKETKENDQ